MVRYVMILILAMLLPGTAMAQSVGGENKPAVLDHRIDES